MMPKDPVMLLSYVKQGTDFSVNNVSESDGWHKYEYVISNAVFAFEKKNCLTILSLWI